MIKKLFDFFRVTWQASEGRILSYSFVPRRGAGFQETIKWVKPEKKPPYDPAHTGDLVPFPTPKYESTYFLFKNSKELETADEKVKKLFSLRYQMPKHSLETYQHELVEKVKSHSYDTNSEEVKIQNEKQKQNCKTVARLTARIRYFQSIIIEKPRKHGRLRKLIKPLIDGRQKKLKLLRLKDYKRFEWLLEKLDLQYRPPVSVTDNRVTRKKSLILLAQLKVEQIKEERLVQLKKKFDEQKIPFLEKKIMKLKEIKEMEEKNNLPTTVTEADIQGCIEKLENTKIEIADRVKRGYKRKIHPYFLEPYEEDLLWEKEKAGELIREKQELKRQNQTAE